MNRVIELTGQRFGRMTVLYRSGSKKHYAQWPCVCDCGHTLDVRSDKLQNGHTKSCGYLKKEFLEKGCQNKTHGETNTRLYRIWVGILRRCENPNREKFKRGYQDRGIIEKALATPVREGGVSSVTA
jgi:hypothetical protein